MNEIHIKVLNNLIEAATGQRIVLFLPWYHQLAPDDLRSATMLEF